MIPLLLAALALAAAWWGLPRLARAKPRDVKRLVYTLAGIALVIGLVMVATGRGGVLVPILAALAAGVVHRLLNRQPDAIPSGHSPTGQTALKDAFALLGLPETANAEEVRAAHQRLMQRLHPDKGGTDALAQQINTARDRILAALTDSGSKA